MRTRVVALLGAIGCVLGIALAIVGPAPQPAFASCETRPVEQMREEADATAIGTIVEIERSASRFGLQSASDPETYWIEISQVFDGLVHELIEVRTTRSHGLDGAAEGRSYLLFLRGETPSFTSDACSSIPLPIQIPDAAETVAGWESVPPEPGGAELPRAGVPWGSIGLGVVLVAMVLLLVRGMRARRRRPTASRS